MEYVGRFAQARYISFSLKGETRSLNAWVLDTLLADVIVMAIYRKDRRGLGPKYLPTVISRMVPYSASVLLMELKVNPFSFKSAEAVHIFDHLISQPNVLLMYSFLLVYNDLERRARNKNTEEMVQTPC